MKNFNRSIPLLASTSFAVLIAALPVEESAAQTARDLRCNGCVDSRDIRNNGITSTDIKNGNVSSTDVKNSSLTGKDVRNGSLTGADIKNGSIGFTDLASDAVYSSTIIVSPIGANDPGNCAVLRDAIDDISDNSFFKPYSIYVEPGFYNCGTEPLNMKPFVSMFGAGPFASILNGNVTGTDGVTGFVNTASSTSITSMSIVNTASEGDCYAVFSNNTDVLLKDMFIQCFPAFGETNGLRISGGSPDVFTSLIQADEAGNGSHGIHVSPTDEVTIVTLNGVISSSTGTAGARSGLEISEDAAVVNAGNSQFSSFGDGVVVAAGSTANIVSSLVTTSSGAGTFNCVGDYDINVAALDANCD